MSHSGNTESSDSDLKLFPRRLDLALDAVVSTQDTSDAEESGEDVSTVPIALPSLQYQVTLFLTSRSKSHQHKRTSLDSNRTYDCVMKRSTSSAKVYTRTLEEDDHSGEVDTDEEKCDEEVDEMTRGAISRSAKWRASISSKKRSKSCLNLLGAKHDQS